MTSKTKDNGLTRKKAYEIIGKMEGRIRSINYNGEWPYCIERAVVFGSYANSDKPRISDIDVGLKVSDRYTEDQSYVVECAYDDLVDEFPSYEQYPFPQYALFRKTLIDIRARSNYISLHIIGEDSAIFSDKTIELCSIGKPFRLPDLK
ncbi:MAG: hypothetical protein E7Z63_06075 [Thermoplasmata archaeon]|nr:hypothetical protein [Thermoplasmata archaeon]